MAYILIYPTQLRPGTDQFQGVWVLMVKLSLTLMLPLNSKTTITRKY